MDKFKYDPKLAADILMKECPGLLTQKQADAIANLAGILEQSRQHNINQQKQTL